MERPDKRAEQRHRILKEGKLLVAPPSGTLDVKIRDVSETGARIELISLCEVPHNTALIAVQTRTIRQCVVVWQRGAQVGLKFTEGPRKIGLRKF